MDTNRLRYFSVVARTGSIREAATALRISPAALSKAIKLLEGEAGLKLILPSGRGIILSEEGKELAKSADTLLNQLDALVQFTREKKRKTAPLRIGSFEVFTTYFMGPFLRDHFNETPVTLHEYIPGELEQGLLEGQIDMGITYLPVPTPGLDHLRVADVKMEVFGKKSNWAGVPFEDLPFVVPVQPLKGTPTKVQGLDGWPDDRVFRNIKYRVALMESAMELCRQGLAVAFLPSFVVQLHNQAVKDSMKLNALPHPLKAKDTVHGAYLVKRKADEENPFHKKVARAIRLICAHG